MPEVILMCLIELLMHENLYFATNFIKLSSLEQKLWPFVELWRPFWKMAAIAIPAIVASGYGSKNLRMGHV